MGKRRLGRGLDSLLGEPWDTMEEAGLVSPESGRPSGGTAQTGLVELAVHEVDPNPYQPRRTFDPLDLAGLIESIQHHGVLQPIVVRQVAQRYQLVVGERRLRAAQEAGLSHVPARIIEADDQQIFELAIVENLQRTDLNAIEKARAFRDYVERFGSTQDELAERLGLDRSTISNFIRLLELPDSIQEAVVAGKLSQGHARALLAVADPARQHQICQRIVTEGLSVRQAEALVGAARQRDARTAPRPSAHKTGHVADLEEMLRERLGTHVEIRLRGKDRGQIVIDFASNDDFQRIVETIRGTELQTVAA